MNLNDAMMMEMSMWQACQTRDGAAFLKVADEEAVMIRGGRKRTGKEYSEIIANFNIVSLQFDSFDILCETDDILQVYYTVRTEAGNSDLAGKFNVTTTWFKIAGKWKVIFNMDQKISG